MYFSVCLIAIGTVWLFAFMLSYLNSTLMQSMRMFALAIPIGFILAIFASVGVHASVERSRAVEICNKQGANLVGKVCVIPAVIQEQSK